MTLGKNHIYLLAAVAIPGSLLYFYFDPSYNKYFPPCPFFTLTGFFCPGCGSQRAFHDLLHGNILAAADHNLMFVLALPLIVFSAIVLVNNLFRGKKLKQALVYNAAFAKGVLVFILVFWLFRNIPLAPFNVLAP